MIEGNVIRVPAGAWLSTAHRDARLLREAHLRRLVKECEAALRAFYRSEKMLYRVQSVAELLDTPEATVRSWIAKGLLPCVRVGTGKKRRGAVYVKREALVEFVEKHRAD